MIFVLPGVVQWHFKKLVLHVYLECSLSVDFIYGSKESRNKKKNVVSLRAWAWVEPSVK